MLKNPNELNNKTKMLPVENERRLHLKCQLLQVSYCHLVPPLILFLTKNPDVSPSTLSTINTIVSGGAPLGKKVSEELTERLKIPVLQGN